MPTIAAPASPIGVPSARVPLQTPYALAPIQTAASSMPAAMATLAICSSFPAPYSRSASTPRWMRLSTTTVKTSSA